MSATYTYMPMLSLYAYGGYVGSVRLRRAPGSRKFTEVMGNPRKAKKSKENQRNPG